MLESYWGFDIHQEDNVGKAFPAPGMLYTQQGSQEEPRLWRGRTSPTLFSTWAGLCP